MLGTLDEDHYNQLDDYDRAWKAHVEHPRLTIPKPDRVVIQTAPGRMRQGVLYMERPKGLGLSKPWIRFGRIIAKGDRVRGVDLGANVMFRENIGRFFGGRFNPIRVTEGHCPWDEIRFSFDYEILAVIEDDITGREAHYKMPGMIGSQVADVLDGRPELLGIAKIRVRDTGEEGYVSYRYLSFDDPKPWILDSTIKTEATRGNFPAPPKP